MKEDIIEIEILPDGTIKSTTDPISPANHSNAEAFFKLLGELTGTVGKRTRRVHKHGTVKHSHGEHDHEGHSH